MIELLKEELDELDKVNWCEGPEYYRFHNFDPNKKPSEDPDKEFEALQTIIDTGISGIENYTLPKYSNRVRYNRNFCGEIIHRIACILKKYYDAKNVMHRGTFYYPPNAECFWHTNADAPGKRIYLTWAEEDNKSFFKYYDNVERKIVTKYDKKGWNVNEFDIPSDGFLWHYIATKDTKRKSVGFMIEHNNENLIHRVEPVLYRVCLKGEDKNKLMTVHEAYKRIIKVPMLFDTRGERDVDEETKRALDIARNMFCSDEFELFRVE
jgi:hypothetical protein